ncbi:MAG TPA: hypothetical protein VK866_18910 [Acidimicrobiales bacterium]|nr:hypothetical protein [Acidimicrobiales bacterium]
MTAVGYEDLLVCHPGVAVVDTDDGPALWHVVDDWVEPIGDRLLTATLRQLAHPRVVRRALVAAGATATAAAHRLLGELGRLVDHQVVLHLDRGDELAVARPTMWGVPAATIGAALADGATAVVLGGPSDGVGPDEVAGWDVLRVRSARADRDPAGAGLVGGLALAGLGVVDGGDVPGGHDVGVARLESWCARLAGAGIVPVVVGDHRTEAAAIAGAVRRHGPVGILHLDEHPRARVDGRDLAIDPAAPADLDPDLRWFATVPADSAVGSGEDTGVVGPGADRVDALVDAVAGRRIVGVGLRGGAGDPTRDPTRHLAAVDLVARVVAAAVGPRP